LLTTKRTAMLKTYKYGRYPSKRQERVLAEPLEEWRWLWNSLLAERKDAWEQGQEAVDDDAQKAERPSLQADIRPGLKAVHYELAQEGVLRLKKRWTPSFGGAKRANPLALRAFGAKAGMTR